MIYGSVCSGHCAVTQALKPRGWTPAFFAEIEAFPAGVLGQRFGATAPRHPIDTATLPPKDRKIWDANNRELVRMSNWAFGDAIPNLGDFTKIDPAEWGHVEWLWGGTPCQSFSVAGKRSGLKDHRGNLTLAFIGLAHELAASGSLRGFTWENVPGILSHKDNPFGCFLGEAVGHDAPIISPHGKGRWPDSGVVVGPRCRLAWRILDTQHFGLPQRRRRLFVVASFGDGPDPVAILLERQGVRRAAAASDGQRQDVAGTITASTGSRIAEEAERGLIVPPLIGGGRKSGGYSHDDVPLTPVLYSAMPMNSGRDFTVREVPVAQPVMAAGPGLGDQGGDYILQPLAFGGNNTAGPISVATARLAHGVPHGHMDFESETFIAEPIAFNMKQVGAAHDSGQVAVAFSMRGRDGENQIEPEAGEVAPALRTGEGGSSKSFVATAVPILEPGKRTGKSTSDARAGIGIGKDGDPMFTLQAGAQHGVAVAADAIRWAVRRLTPVECERLQGTADNFTRIPWRGKPAEDCPDGPRYKVCGNSMSVDVIIWIGDRIRNAS